MALNAGADVARVLRHVWYLLDGADAHAMAGYKLVERAKNPTWRDPVAIFEIERHGDPAGQIQTWNVNLARGTAECVHERPLRPQTSQLQQDEGALVAELASLIRAGEDDPRLRWDGDRRHGVKVLADSALGGATSSQAKRLREAIAAELGDAWVRDRGCLSERSRIPVASNLPNAVEVKRHFCTLAHGRTKTSPELQN